MNVIVVGERGLSIAATQTQTQKEKAGDVLFSRFSGVLGGGEVSERAAR